MSRRQPSIAFGEPASGKKWNRGNSTARKPPHTEFLLSASAPERAHRHRNRSMYAQALVLFNVLGIPLSCGTRLERNFTNTFPTRSLTSLAMIPALQILLIATAPLPVGYLYNVLTRQDDQERQVHWSWSWSWSWKLFFGLSSLLATTCQLVSYFAPQNYIAILLLQSLGMGAGLGSCFTISTLVLATHYRNDVPLVSVQSGFAGFAGAVVYTVLARFSSQADNGLGWVCVYQGGVMGATLLAAFFLLIRLHPVEDKAWTLGERFRLRLCMPQDFLFGGLRGGGMWFLIGYVLVSTGVLIYPVYGTVLLTQAPALFYPDMAAYGVLGMFGVAAVSGSVAANLRCLKGVGAVNVFVAAAVLAGAVVLAPVVWPRLYVVVPLAVVYGVAIGAVLSLHMIVVAEFLSKKVDGRWEDDMAACVAIVMALAGLGAFGGVVGAAALIEGSERGWQIAFRVASAFMIGGGVLIGCVRMWRWKRIFYAV